jgi:hypothetical protein
MQNFLNDNLNDNLNEVDKKKNIIALAKHNRHLKKKKIRNLLIIGYCNLEDGFLYGSKALERLNYKIFFFPYLSYLMDKVENIDDILIENIKNWEIEICLWWSNSVKSDNYKKILSNINVKNYFFNWDPFLYNYEKYNCPFWEELIENKKIFYPLMDHIFSCFETEINYFKNKLSISYLSPGFDKNISTYVYDQKYECDVSIVCTNLYNNLSEFPLETSNLTRYEIVTKLYDNRDKINFHIYGPEHFNELYPECYKGFISYNNCYKVFSNSKINLSIHPLVNELNKPNSNEEYFSERVPQILGSRGLLVTNSYLTHKLTPDQDYIYIDNTMDWYEKIDDIINNTAKYNIIRKNGYNKGIKYYQWDSWATSIDKIIEECHS